MYIWRDYKNDNTIASKDVDILLYKRDKANIVTAPFEPMKVINIERTASAELVHNLKAPMNGFTCPADVGFMGKITSGSAQVEVTFELMLVKDGE